MLTAGKIVGDTELFIDRRKQDPQDWNFQESILEKKEEGSEPEELKQSYCVSTAVRRRKNIGRTAEPDEEQESNKRTFWIIDDIGQLLSELCPGKEQKDSDCSSNNNIYEQDETEWKIFCNMTSEKPF